MDTNINNQRRRSTDSSQIQEEAQIAGTKQRLENSVVSHLVKRSNRILASIRTHKFPIDIFPDTINVEEGRITIITRDFFFTSQVHSVDIKDISNVFVNTMPFYASLEIVSRTFEDNEITIRALWRSEAILIRRLIEGMRVLEFKQIDTSNYTKEELVAKLKELSTTKTVT
jgi:hypothetical protein